MAFQIDVSLDDYKALTQLLRDEADSYSDVIHRLIRDYGLPQPPVLGVTPQQENFSDADQPVKYGLWVKNLHLPNGTKLRANYKGQTYYAIIKLDKWHDGNDRRFNSPSEAASAITGNNVNGWRFWFAQRPSDLGWTRLDILGGR